MLVEYQIDEYSVGESHIGRYTYKVGISRYGPAALPIIAGAGLVNSVVQGNRANSAQKKALDQQGQIAGRQAALFDESNPYYQALVHAYGQHAGLVPDGSGGFTVGSTNSYENP